MTILVIGVKSIGDNVELSLRGHVQLQRAAATTHRLRICNAAPDKGALQVAYNGSPLTAIGLLYKQCQEWTTVLVAGGSLDFTLGAASAGGLVLADLPEVAVVAVVVRDVLGLAGSPFSSQVFEDRRSGAQLASFDAYQGAGDSATWIQDPSQDESIRSERLHYDNTVMVQPGRYEVLLHGDDGVVKDRDSMVALSGESYVVVRCGGPGSIGVYPEDLLVFPVSDPAGLYTAPPSPPPPSFEMPTVEPPSFEPPEMEVPKAANPEKHGTALSLFAAFGCGALALTLVVIAAMMIAVQ